MSQARFEVVFYGHVQGVGFRMTAARCAEMLSLVGWVRNEPDGKRSSRYGGYGRGT